MKIKKHIAALLAAAAMAGGTWSCTDLDEVTYDRIDATQYFKDESAVKGAIASIYSSCAAFWEYFWYLNEYSADQIAWRTWNGGEWGWDEAEKFVLSSQTWNSEATYIRNAWQNAWRTIGLCNTFMDAMQNISPETLDITQEAYDGYIAEVRTIRAWAYYNNFELWGGALPICTTASGDIPGSASTDFNEGCQIIWDFIVDELDACYADLTAEQGIAGTRLRVNQGMNRMLKMRMLLNSQLWTGVDRYNDCAALCQQIINGEFGQYQLAADYRDIFSINNSNCPEVVFAMSTQVGQLTNNNRDTPFLPYKYTEIFGCENTADQSGWWCVILDPSKDNYGEVINNNGTDAGRSFIFYYGDQLGAPYDRMNDYDIRKQPFTCDAAGNWQGMFLIGPQLSYETGEVVISESEDTPGMPIDLVDQVGTFVGKGKPLEVVMSPRWGTLNSGLQMLRYPIYPDASGLDWRNIPQVEFRLTEVYYTLAECQLRAGNQGSAVQTVNQVRQRYFPTHPEQLDLPSPGFTSFNLDWMLSEWGLEFLDEGRRRRTDLRRFDKFTQGQWWFFGRAQEDDRDLPAVRSRKYEWYPLPQVALTANPGLVQNPNY